jgi:hypothetical protein
MFPKHSTETSAVINPASQEAGKHRDQKCDLQDMPNEQHPDNVNKETVHTLAVGRFKGLQTTHKARATHISASKKATAVQQGPWVMMSHS